MFTKKCCEKINAVKNSPASPTKEKNQIRVNQCKSASKKMSGGLLCKPLTTLAIVIIFDYAYLPATLIAQSNRSPSGVHSGYPLRSRSTTNDMLLGLFR